MTLKIERFSERHGIKLRFINGSAMTFFDVRIPGLQMKVVAADGNAIEPVTVDEFRIGTAETYDVIVAPDNMKMKGMGPDGKMDMGTMPVMDMSSVNSMADMARVCN
jgi:FtsP/CotA-like multicopper oxidase with cupredoxin domain